MKTRRNSFLSFRSPNSDLRFFYQADAIAERRGGCSDSPAPAGGAGRAQGEGGGARSRSRIAGGGGRADLRPAAAAWLGGRRRGPLKTRTSCQDGTYAN